MTKEIENSTIKTTAAIAVDTYGNLEVILP